MATTTPDDLGPRLADLLADTDRMSAAGLRAEQSGPLLTITLDRPERRNAMTPAMWAAMAEIGRLLPDEVRVVVLRGAGAAFCAGLDHAMLTPDGPPGEDGFAALLAGDDAGVEQGIATYQDGFVWLHRPEIVSVAQVHGYAIGGGFQLALACDLRIAATDATFSMKEPALGIVPDLAGTKPLVSAVGYARALEICVTARMVAADEAESIGLVQQVVAPEDLDGVVAGLATDLAAHPVEAVRRTKALLQGAGDRTLEEQALAERRAQVPLLRRLAQG